MASEKGSDTSNGDTVDQVCRDFLRNVCRRGKRCKYMHPNESEQESLGAAVGAAKKEYVFCHDYQNTQCTRLNCRFIHCTREEEHFFKLTGELPEHVLQDSIRKGITIDPSNPGNAPVCKDYLKGSCRRAGKCKFRHLTLREYEIELGFHIGSLPSWQTPGATTTTTTAAAAAAVATVTASRRRGYEDGEYDYYGKSSTAGIGYDGELGPPEVKRRHIVSLDPHTHTICIREEPEIPNEHTYPAQPATTDMTTYHAAAQSTLAEDGTTTEVPQPETEEQKVQVAPPPDATATSEYYPTEQSVPSYDPSYESYGQCYCCYSTTCYNAQHWSSYYAGSTYYSPDSTSSSPSSQANGQYWQNSQHTTSHSQC